jgi:hypothetical protein
MFTMKAGPKRKGATRKAIQPKRKRATRAEMEARYVALIQIVAEQQPMSVRQVLRRRQHALDARRGPPAGSVGPARGMSLFAASFEGQFYKL